MEKNEILLMVRIAKEEYEVGDQVVCDAGAPGIGRVIYKVTRLEDDGKLFAIELENTIRVPDYY